MKPVTVMQVVLSLRVGGLERVVVDLVQNASADFQFVICCLETAGPWAAQLRAPVITLGRKPGLDLRLIPKLARLARAHNVRVVHTHNAGAHFYGALGGKLAGAKVLHTEHGKNVGEESRAHRVNRFAARFTDFTVAVSENNARIAVEHEGARADRLQVVPNGIPVERFRVPVDRARLRRELGLPASARVIGTVGRLVREKNYPLLLRAFAGMENTYLVFVGDGPLRGELEKQADRQRVFFLGAREDVPEILGSLDAFVLSSSTEGMSMALLEAMAAGCPIVVTAVGGNVELIQHGETGLVVPADDEVALRGALERVIGDRQLGAAAQQRVRQRYSVQEMTRQYETLYRNLSGKES